MNKKVVVGIVIGVILASAFFCGVLRNWDVNKAKATAAAKEATRTVAHVPTASPTPPPPGDFVYPGKTKYFGEKPELIDGAINKACTDLPKWYFGIPSTEKNTVLMQDSGPIGGTVREAKFKIWLTVYVNDRKIEYYPPSPIEYPIDIYQWSPERKEYVLELDRLIWVNRADQLVRDVGPIYVTTTWNWLQHEKVNFQYFIWKLDSTSVTCSRSIN